MTTTTRTTINEAFHDTPLYGGDIDLGTFISHDFGYSPVTEEDGDIEEPEYKPTKIDLEIEAAGDSLATSTERRLEAARQELAAAEKQIADLDHARMMAEDKKQQAVIHISSLQRKSEERVVLFETLSDEVRRLEEEISVKQAELDDHRRDQLEVMNRTNASLVHLNEDVNGVYEQGISSDMLRSKIEAKLDDLIELQRKNDVEVQRAFDYEPKTIEKAYELENTKIKLLQIQGGIQRDIERTGRQLVSANEYKSSMEYLQAKMPIIDDCEQSLRELKQKREAVHQEIFDITGYRLNTEVIEDSPEQTATDAVDTSEDALEGHVLEEDTVSAHNPTNGSLLPVPPPGWQGVQPTSSSLRDRGQRAQRVLIGADVRYGN